MNIISAPGHYEQKDSFILYKFDDMESRTANLKSVEKLKKEFKRGSVTIKNIFLLICSLSLAVTGSSLNITFHTKHHCIRLIKPFGILKLLYLGRNKRIL